MTPRIRPPEPDPANHHLPPSFPRPLLSRRRLRSAAQSRPFSNHRPNPNPKRPHSMVHPPHHPTLLPPPGRPWSETETSQLISAYFHVWHSLRRGHLSSQHWERVASLASLRRTGTQCRHKMEKLRKRYRQERKNLPVPSSWPYFRQIDRMERGESDVEEEEEEEEEEEDEEEEKEADLLVGVVRRFEEGFLRMERRRAEVMVEMEREWMRMEERRTEMVVQAERWMIDSIARAFKFGRSSMSSHHRHDDPSSI